MSTPAFSSDETLDSIGTAGVRVWQRRGGYRFTLDAVLLAAFAATEAGQVEGPLLELGAGSGVVSFLLACQFGLGPVDALELQPEVHARLTRAVALNGCDGRVRPVLGDLREARTSWASGAYAHVVSNPPFRPAHAGVRSPDDERAVSKQELTCDAAAVVAAARHSLPPGGRVSLIYPAARVAEVLGLLSAARLHPMALRFVHARAGAPATRFLVHAVRDRQRGLAVRPPLLAHGEGPGGYSPEVAGLMEPPRAERPAPLWEGHDGE
ncbi:tRNA (adenine37-N(6))-methyltransferase TrmN6 [Cystobacter fuscus DSM 2262]|uniref:tRNA (Adenine37-N(6))-methyltransferase TrmN6 n=1 Tax=Cystobacter fuscus (strain ATCC 25194 / DSM 2262 / NBRC 100088 / M29) TaxID=1242864 RepID=S9PMB1_CYSF2|nr:methyltransferase [Cystobacter fuscus]EPX64131.1 tRNA (adenine37-N(6))-methyltransferase TrmN6 [Cystobacter fuscus DSM 2262]